MKIKSIKFKNFNSYGNKLQELSFSDTGNLILLKGKNGHGKSTIKQVLDFLLYNKVVDKDGKKLPLSELPNRRNLSLYSYIEFINNNDDIIKITKQLKPNKFNIIINNNDITKDYKLFNIKQKEDIIGFNYDLYKLFISLNINDFKNFITLNTDEKIVLLNKLFNLEKTTILLSITQDLYNSVKDKINDYKIKFSSNKEKIIDLTNTYNKIKPNDNIDINILKNKYNSHKPDYIKLKKDINEYNIQIEEIKEKFKVLNKNKYLKENERNKNFIRIENLKEKLEIYKTGICPVCNTKLDNNHKHKIELDRKVENIQKEINKQKEYIDTCILEYAKLENELKEKSKLKNQKLEKLNIFKIDLKVLKDKISNYNNNLNNAEQELLNKIEKLKNSNNIIKNNVLKLKEKLKIYKKIIEILSFNNIKNKMMLNSLDILNKYLKYNLGKLKSKYTAEIDTNFNIKVYELGTLRINPQTLSNGEQRKINISIALSYLRLILKSKNINIMFLDELFDGVDYENNELILKLLKEIVSKHKINIIIIAFSELNLSYFDEIIEVNRDIFSDIDIVKKKQFKN